MKASWIRQRGCLIERMRARVDLADRSGAAAIGGKAHHAAGQRRMSHWVRLACRTLAGSLGYSAYGKRGAMPMRNVVAETLSEHMRSLPELDK